MAESNYGRVTFGDPCRECGWSWSVDEATAIRCVAQTPAQFAALVAGRDGSERHPDLAWPVGGYVCHVADNLRIWAERLAGVALGASRKVTAYDQDALAEARRYPSVPLEAALWSLGRAVGDWEDAVSLARARQVRLDHSERGVLTVLDVIRSNAHDAWHHGWDIQRSIVATSGPPD
jgi:hypothetical protein